MLLLTVCEALGAGQPIHLANLAASQPRAACRLF